MPTSGCWRWGSPPISTSFLTDYSGLFAMASLTTIPVVVVFMLFQRYLVGGLAAGAVKS